MTNNWEYDYSSLYNNAQNAQNQAAAQSAQRAASGPAVNTQAEDAQRAASGPAYTGAQPAGAAYGAQQTASGPAYGSAQNAAYAAPNTETVHRTVYEAPQQPQQKKRGAGKRILAGALAVVLCGAFGVGGGYLGATLADKGKTTVVYQAASSAADTGVAATVAAGTDGMTVAQIAAAAGPSVVEVTTESVATNAILGQYVTDGAGSGVIISADGYIITNNHVVSGAQHLTVTTSDGSEYTATVVGTDSKTDIAVMKIDATGLTPAVIGDSAALAVGETVVAVGNPLGQLGGTVTDGIVSALDREITINNETMTLLQTNAAVSPGNSGGGLFNSKGELIGIVNAKSGASNTEGIGFAIPVNSAISVAQELIDNGYVTGRPALGVSVVEISDASTAMQYGVSSYGVYVAAVNAGGAAEAAGLQVGDLIVSIDGNTVSATADVTGCLADKAVGDTVEVQVARSGKLVSATLTLQEMAAGTTATNDLPEQQDSSASAQGGYGSFGGSGVFGG